MKITLSFFSLLTAAMLFQASAFARINVVTLPDRDSVQLTIYNSVDLTMVKETRFLTFRKGLNKLEFSWANTLIDPTSLEFRALTHADEVELLDVSFPPRVENTLEWRINSEYAGEVQVEIRYFTSGIKWSADYVAEVNKPEKLMDFAGHVRVTNNSGEDYENAEVRLVVGTIRLVEDIVTLARRGMDKDKTISLSTLAPAAAAQVRGAMADSLGRAEEAKKEREITKEALSEYFLYTVEGRDTIPNGWSKRLPSFRAANVPLISYYKYERERWNDQVMRHYRFKNDKANQLGNEPLPDGDVKAFRFVTADKLYSFVGRTTVKYIPLDEQVEMEMGHDAEVLVKPVLMNWEKAGIRFSNEGNITGWTIKETWEIEVQNSKEIDVVLDVRRNFQGDWSIKTEAKFEKVDSNKIKFVLPLKSLEKRKITYEVTTHHGVNVTR
jgi:hypothetical protein